MRAPVLVSPACVIWLCPFPTQPLNFTAKNLGLAAGRRTHRLLGSSTQGSLLLQCKYTRRVSVHGPESINTQLAATRPGAARKHIHQQKGSIGVINTLIYNLSTRGTFEEQNSHLLKHIYPSLRQGPEYKG